MALTTVRPQGMGFNTGRRNLIINGAMQVAQRGTSSTGNTGGGYKTVDRFTVETAGRDNLIYTAEQVSDAPVGFTNSFKFTTTTAESAIDADDAFWFAQKIEAQNLQHIKNGSSGAVSTTVSFYVKSSQTGTFGVSIYKADNTARIINSTYTISSANTWEYKTITFAGDTGGGGINNDDGEGLRISWFLAAGSNYDSVNSTSWANYITTNWAGGHAQDSVITTANATWQLAGVQFEVGENASDFEHRSFGEELNLCQRYYQKIGPAADGSAANRTIYGLGFVINSSNFRPLINFPVKFRTAPGAIETSGTASHFSCSFGADSSQALNSVPTYDVANSTTFFGGCNLSGTPLNTSEVVTLRSNHADSYLAWDAEL